MAHELYLLVGILFKVLSQYRWGVEFFGWFHLAPFLAYVIRTNSGMTWRHYGCLFLSLQLASILGTLKIVTPPVPAALAFAFGIPEGIGFFVVISVFGAFQRRLPRICAILFYVSLMVLLDWANFEHSPLGMWSTGATSQVMSNLPLLQLASLGGVALIGAVLSTVQVSVAFFVSDPNKARARRVIPFAFVVVCAAMTFGSLRMFSARTGPTVKVAGVVTNLLLDPASPLPAKDILDEEIDAMFARTEYATSCGAQIVVWNEVAIALRESDSSEDAFLSRGAANFRSPSLIRQEFPPPHQHQQHRQKRRTKTPATARHRLHQHPSSRNSEYLQQTEQSSNLRKEPQVHLRPPGSALARETGADLVLGYAVILDSTHEEFFYDNQFVWISGSDGRILETYRKHHPVPGEPCIRGEEDLVVHQRPWGRATGAICYDYDFPSMVREVAQLSPGLAVVPSSDWLGIDPYHTRMARLRGIEGGFSVIRPVRLATSEASDAYGRVRGSLPWTEGNRVFVVDLPVKAVQTVYGMWGDLPCLVFAFGVVVVCVVLLFVWRKKKKTS